MRKALFQHKTLYTLFVLSALHFIGCRQSDNSAGETSVAACRQDTLSVWINRANELLKHHSDSAAMLLDAIENDVEQSGIDTVKCNFYMRKGMLHSLKMELEKSDDFFEKGLQTSLNCNDTDYIAGFYLNLGINRKKRGNIEPAAEYYRKALRLGEKQRNKTTVARACNNLGMTYKDEGKYDTAIVYYNRALALSKQLENKTIEGNVLMNLGFLYFHFKDYDNAFRYNQMAIPVLKAENNSRSLYLAYLDCATPLIYLKRYSQAAAYLDSAETICRELNATNETGAVFQRRGFLLSEQKQFPAALEMYKKSLAMLSDSLEIMVDHYSMCYTYLCMGNFSAAKKSGLEALEIGEKSGTFRNKMNIYKNLSLTYTALGDLENAVKYAGYADAIRDSLFNAEKYRILHDVESKYQTREKEREIAFSHLTIKSQQRSIALLIVLCVVLVAGAVVYLFLQRKRLQSNIALVQKNKELTAITEQCFNKKNGNILAGEKGEDILIKLNAIFETEKAYLLPKLSIMYVADKVDTNRDYLSKVINERLGKNFTEYINYFRVEEAKKILEAQVKGENAYLMESIAQKSGFTGSTTFYIAFKQQVGMTPTEYKKAFKSTVKNKVSNMQ